MLVRDALGREKLLNHIQEELTIVFEKTSVLDDTLKVLVGYQVRVVGKEVDTQKLFDQHDVSARVSQLFSLIKWYTLVKVMD